MGLFDLFFGQKVNLDELVQQGAVIVDVRTPGEFNHGHVKGSVNIPLDTLSKSMSKIPKNKPVITCCASGNRSGMAKRILKANGYNVHNGGSWSGLRKYGK